MGKNFRFFQRNLRTKIISRTFFLQLVILIFSFSLSNRIIFPHCQITLPILTTQTSLTIIIAAKYLASTKRPDHSTNWVVNLPPGAQQKNETLSTKVGHLVNPHLVDNVVPSGAFRVTIDSIHTKVVEEANSRSSDNRVLGALTPKIDPFELSLSRPTRSVLAQLKSGHCAKLQYFQFHIGSSVSGQCPEYQSSSDSVAHLSSCPSHQSCGVGEF